MAKDADDESVKKAAPKDQPVGPFEPPTPTEAAQQRDKPMAVAADEDAKMQSFAPTTQFQDQFSPEVARAWRDPNLPDPDGRQEHTGGKRGDEEAEAHPPGFTPAPRGFEEMDTEEEKE